jgi:ubiquinone/menaquinone biosynthesis C-methylase UbiE
MSHYLHGSDPREQSRLSRLNELINDRCFPKVSVKKGFRVLDVGSGLGQFTHRLWQAVGDGGRCLGIERDKNQLAVAMKNYDAPNLEFREGDAAEIPLTDAEWGQFDLAHARFLLEHLANPAKTVAQMKSALRPGGKMFLADDDHQTLTLYPEPSGFQKLWAAYMDSYIEVGNDPFIGRKLTKLLFDAGMKNILNNVVFFGDCAGTKTFKLFADNLTEVISTSHAIMVEGKLISEDDYQTAIQNIDAWSLLPYASLWYTICVAVGEK